MYLVMWIGVIYIRGGNHFQRCLTNIKNICNAVKHMINETKSITDKMNKLNKGFQKMADQLAQAMQGLVDKAIETTNKALGMVPVTPVSYDPDCTAIIAKETLQLGRS